MKRLPRYRQQHLVRQLVTVRENMEYAISISDGDEREAVIKRAIAQIKALEADPELIVAEAEGKVKE